MNGPYFFDLANPLRNWHGWFAWHPVMIPEGWAWLRTIHRRWSDDDGWTPIEYHCWEYK